MAGRHRTPDPLPMLGPARVTTEWLLEQTTWWYPHRSPAVLIASMDKPWRWNTVRFLERRAIELHQVCTEKYMWNAPDDVWSSWRAEDPLRWLHRRPLLKRLNKGLPPEASAAGRSLATRAVHWHTCPMRRRVPGRLDRCVCIRGGGFSRVIGASNDPDSPPMRVDR